MTLENQKIIIWGTGNYAETLMRELLELNQYLKPIEVDIIDNLLGFIDSAQLDRKEKFFDKEVYYPDYLYAHSDVTCVVAVLDNKEIFDELELHGIDSVDYIEYIRCIKSYIIHSIDKLLQDAKLCENRLIKNNLIISKKLMSDNLKKEKVLELVSSYGIENFVAASSWYFGQDIEWLADCFYKETESRKEIRTVGIVAYRFFGGGIEKVIQLLIELYVKAGLNVVLITDEKDDSLDFSLPNNVQRYVMENKYNMSCYDRICEIGDCVRKYSIDVMCFHFGYNRLSTFYEMLYCKLNQIPVIIEIHSGFMPILNSKKNIAKKIPLMYRIADRVVTLSETDKLFWQNLGSRAIYIPNPISRDVKKVEHEKTNLIVWVGRIVQSPKQVFDVIPIIERVTKRVNAKCIVVGNVDKKYDYERFKNLISENQLEKYIEIKAYTPDVGPIYENADIVLMTSANESFSNVIQESKQYGIPLVLYKLPWLELLRDGKGYVAVEQNDVEAASEAIINILEDRQYWKKLSCEALDSIKTFASYDVLNAWKELFFDITNSSFNYQKNFEAENIQKQLLGELFND